VVRMPAMREPHRLTGCLLLLTACGAPPPASHPVAVSEQPHGEPAPGPSSSDLGEEPEADAPTPGPSSLLRATTSMVMDGSIEAVALVAQLNRQVGILDPCVSKIRATDDVVGSLNLEVAIVSDGEAGFEVQSDVNDEARACLHEGLESIQIRAVGTGRAMVLLELTDRAVSP